MDKKDSIKDEIEFMFDVYGKQCNIDYRNERLNIVENKVYEKK